MSSRLREIDRPLAAVVVALAAYGLATLYSAGQTDVPTLVATIWQRQVVWLGLVGVLQINARIPSGIQPGNAVPVVVQVGNVSSREIGRAHV